MRAYRSCGLRNCLPSVRGRLSLSPALTGGAFSCVAWLLRRDSSARRCVVALLRRVVADRTHSLRAPRRFLEAMRCGLRRTARCPVIADLDIWRVAALLVKRHGKDASIFAAQRIDELLAEGDLDGRAVWQRILEAVKELERAKPAEGERVNRAASKEGQRRVNPALFCTRCNRVRQSRMPRRLISSCSARSEPCRRASVLRSSWSFSLRYSLALSR